MQKETEIKLRASRETLLALREHPLLKKRNKSGWSRHELFNQYYDTAERELAHARVALRLRRDGEQFIQTLKSRGQSVAGLSERNEWDWYLDKAKLDIKKLGDDCWPASLADLDKKTLKPIFTTDFVREKAEIAWGRGKTRVVIEAALDLGQVKAGKQSEEICELELELRQGEPEALLELAAELAADLPLMPCDISKAERGYRLYDADGYSLQLPAPELTASMPLDDAVVALGWQLLGNSQRLAEQYRFNGRWKLLGEWLQQLVELRALLGSLGQAAPRASSRELRELLDMLIQDWRPRVEAGQDDEGCARPHRRSSPRNWVRPAGACCRSRRPSGCCNAAGPKAATPVAIARVPPSWANGCRTCWPKKPRLCSCRATSSSRKTWPSRARAWSACWYGCTWRAACWSYRKPTVSTANWPSSTKWPVSRWTKQRASNASSRPIGYGRSRPGSCWKNNGITLRKVEPRRQTTPGV